MNFEIVQTNIVNIAADAIVLPSNTKLKEGSGTSTAIFQAAGRDELTKACRDIGTCEVGSAVPTLAFNLDAKYIIHTVVPKWIDGKNNEYDLLSSAYLSALNIADIMGCRSIAFPLLASGNNGFDLSLAFQIAKESISSFSGSRLNKVILVLFGDNMSSFVRQLGYKVIEIPAYKEETKNAKKDKALKSARVKKDAPIEYLQAQIKKAFDYIMVYENRKKIYDEGMLIVKLILAVQGLKA